MIVAKDEAVRDAKAAVVEVRDVTLAASDATTRVHRATPINRPPMLLVARLRL